MIIPSTQTKSPKGRANNTLNNLPSREKAWNAAKRFEGIFVGMLIRDMRKSADSLGDGMFGKAPGSGVQSQLFNRLLSDKMAQSGRIGLAKALMEDWERQRLIPQKTLAQPTPINLSTEDSLTQKGHLNASALKRIDHE